MRQTVASKKESRWSHKKPKRELTEKLCYAEWGGKRRITQKRSDLHLVSARHDTRDTEIIQRTESNGMSTGPHA